MRTSQVGADICGIMDIGQVKIHSPGDKKTCQLIIDPH